MKKYQFLLIVSVLCLQAGNIWSQYVVKTQEELSNIKQLAQEKVYINHTGPMALTGEYIYYSFSCFNTQTNRVSNISKLGYVSLVNSNGEFVFTQKLRLDKGLAQGDFFLKTDMPSGIYKLLGYTHWMKNNGLSQFFQQDLVIVNPYMVDQTALLGEGTEKGPPTKNEYIEDKSTILLELDTLTYATRSKVRLSLRNYKGYLGNGYYTIKVKKKNTLESPLVMRAPEFSDKYFAIPKEIDKAVGDNIYLPEQRGELFFGNVSYVNTNEPVENEPIVISIPGKEFILKFATTDAKGNFFGYLQKEYKSENIIAQASGTDEYKITIKDKSTPDLGDMEFASFTLNKDDADFIKGQSVYNQIENQFFGLKPDSVLVADPIDPFDGGTPEVFNLDDYTRFPTFQETLVEILNNAGYRNNGKGNDYIRIAQDFETYNEEYNILPSIVVFDGVYIPNHEVLKDYNARKIKSISLIRDKFQLANKEYQGIMSVETFDGDYLKEHAHSNKTVANLTRPFPKKRYYRQEYRDNSNYERVPDYRTLLCWEPNIILEGSGTDLVFYTSDVKGEYEILLDGFTTYGKPISLTETITVE